MIETVWIETDESADEVEKETRTPALGPLLNLWKVEGPGVDLALNTLNTQAAIRLDMVRSAKERATPREFQREVVRQARNALEATLADHHSHPEIRKAAAFHLAELQLEAGKFFAAKRALKLIGENSFSADRVQSISMAIEEGIKEAHLLRECRQLNLAREEKGRRLVDQARKAARKSDHQRATQLANESLASFTLVLESADARVVARAQFDAARAHLLLARLTGEASHIETARQHSSAITKRLPVRSATQDAFIDRKELRAMRRQITISEKKIAKLPSNNFRAYLQRLAAPIKRVLTLYPSHKLRNMATTCLAMTSALTLLGAPADHAAIAMASAKPLAVQSGPSAEELRANLIASEQAKLNALYAQRGAVQQQLDAANADYLAKKQLDDSLTGPEGAARAVREAGIENRVLGVATSGAESSYGQSKYSGWTDAQGNEHVRVEPNQTVGIGLFQQSVPVGEFNAQTPYVVSLENNIDFNAVEAQKNYIGPHGGRFTSFCADYTPGHCMDGRYYLAPGSPVLRFIPTAQDVVADEQAKYDAEVAAEAQVAAAQKQLDDLNVQIDQERAVLKQEVRDSVMT